MVYSVNLHAVLVPVLVSSGLCLGLGLGLRLGLGIGFEVCGLDLVSKSRLRSTLHSRVLSCLTD